MLRAHGYEPWLDTENGIPVCEPFDLAIELGIAGSDALVALLSPWSLRPEGFCRNELLFAQAHAKPIVPVRIAEVTPPIQIISLNYIDALSAAGNPTAAFAEIPSIIATALQAGSVGRREWPTAGSSVERSWWQAPSALDFSEELARHGSSFVGREWLFERLAALLVEPDTRLVLLEGAAGLGKSALAAQLTARLNVKGVHFCSRSNLASCRPQSWLQGLAFQLAAQYAPYRERLAALPIPDWEDPPESLFRTLIAAPLASCREEIEVTEPWVLVVDGLDEARAESGDSLPDLLSRSLARLPDFLRLVVTTRPDRDTEAQFDLPGACTVTLASDEEGNLCDLDAYAQRRALDVLGAPAPTADCEALAAGVAELAAGNFLYARLAFEALAAESSGERLTLAELRELPPGLGGLYFEMFAKRFADEAAYERDALPLLDCLVAARGPLPEALLKAASGLEERAARRGLRALSQFLDETPSGLRLFHQSLADWLSDERASRRFAAIIEEGAQRVTDACWAQFSAGVAEMDDYASTHLIAHLSDAGRWHDLAAALTELGFLSVAWERDECNVMRAWSAVEAHIGMERGVAYASFVADPGLAGGSQVALGRVARLLFRKGNLPEALVLFKEQERICRETGDRAGLQAALGNQAMILKSRGRLEEALALFREKARICCELELSDGLQNSLGGQALILRAWGRLDDAMDLLKEKERICRELGSAVGLQSSLGNQALILRSRGDLDTAMALLLEKERICRESCLSVGLQAALGAQARILQDWGQLNEAMTLLEEKERICRELGLPVGLHISLGIQASILRIQGKLDEAMILVTEKERICRELKLPAGLQDSLGGQARILRDWGRHDEAMARHKEEERTCRELKLRADLHRSLGDQAECLLGAGRPAEALPLIDESIELTRSLESPDLEDRLELRERIVRRLEEIE